MKPQMRHMYFFTMTVRRAHEAPFFAARLSRGRSSLVVCAPLHGGREPIEALDGVRQLEQRLLDSEAQRQNLDEPGADPPGVVERHGCIAI